MKKIRKLLFIAVILIVVYMSISGCGKVVNTASTGSQSLDSTSGNTSETSALSTTNSTGNQGETSVPIVKSTDSSQNSSVSTITSSEKSQTNTSNIKSISVEDFDVYYKDIVLNSSTSLEVLSEKLGFAPVEEDNDTTLIRAAGFNNDMDYCWYQFSYPNKEHPEIIFDYLYNATKKTGRIVSIDLKNNKTNRGIAVGDSVKKIKLTYGNKFEPNYNGETTEYIDFAQNNNTLTFIYEIKSQKIIKEKIDFDSNKAMEEMDITSLED